MIISGDTYDASGNVLPCRDLTADELQTVAQIIAEVGKSFGAIMRHPDRPTVLLNADQIAALLA